MLKLKTLAVKIARVFNIKVDFFTKEEASDSKLKFSWIIGKTKDIVG